MAFDPRGALDQRWGKLDQRVGGAGPHLNVGPIEGCVCCSSHIFQYDTHLGPAAARRAGALGCDLDKLDQRWTRSISGWHLDQRA